jgi:hypothetical protein
MVCLRTQITGLIFFADYTDALAGLVPNVILFLTEIAWERLGVKGIEGENAFALFGFWCLSALLPIFIVVVGAISCECIFFARYFRMSCRCS